MGEKLSKFIELYNTKSAANLEKTTSKLAEFNAARKAALALTTPVGEKYKTLGDLVNEMIPQNGKINDDLFYNVYASLTLEAEDRKVVDALFKLKYAPAAHARAVASNELGGAAYFNLVMESIGEAMIRTGVKFDDLIGKNSKKSEEEKLDDFSDVLESLDFYQGEPIPDAPSGVMSSVELYEAVIENGSPIKKKEEGAPGSINEGAEKKGTPAAPAATSAVNPEKAEGAAKTEVTTSAGQVTSAPPEVPAELEKKEEKPTVNINLPPATEPTPTAPVAAPEAAPAPTAASPINVTEVTNISKEETTKTESAVTSSVSSLSSTTEGAVSTQTSTTVGPTVSQINEQKITGGQFTEGATSTSSLMSMISQIGKSAGFEGEVADKLGEKLAPALGSGTINESAKTKAGAGETEEEENLTKSASVESLNETKEKALGESKEKVTGASPTINEASATKAKAGKAAAMAEVAKRFGIDLGMASAPPKLTPEPEISENVSSETPALPQQMEVSKTLPTIPKEAEPPVSQPAPPAAQEMAPATMPEEKPGTAAGAASQAGEKAAGEVPAASKTSINLSSLEGRLARIEYLLAGTLDVKIVD